MNTDLLRLFETVVEEGSFSKAGQRLFRSQPAVSQAVKRLEEDLGAQLLDRSSRALRLTDSGRAVSSFARRFLSLERELRLRLEELRDLRSGKLTIGANESAALYLLGHVEAYRRRHPGINVELRRSLSSRIPEAVLDGALELGAVSYDPGDPRLLSIKLYEDRLTFVVSPRHRFAERRRVSIRELGGEVFIAHNVVSPYRARVIESFRKHQVRLHMPVEMPTIETIRRLVQRNLGVAFLPKMCVEQQILSGSLREVAVREIFMERTIRLVRPARRKLSRASLAFLELVAGKRPAEASPLDGETGPPAGA